MRDHDVVDSVLETIDLTLSQTELDQLIALSEKNKIEGCPQALHFILHGKNLILEKANPVTEDRLFSTKLPEKDLPIAWPSVLRGIPCSPGITIAPSVHQKTFDASKAQGKIVILPFLNLRDASDIQGIKGLILEKGSVLSHVGILARERGIPCIMGAKDSKLIPEGATIKLDAINGTINPVL